MSKDEKSMIDSHKPILIKKIVFHDFVDVRGKNRIVRFIIFRNMLLEKIKSVTLELGMTGFDYVMMIDLDIREFDAKSLFRDLNDSPYSIICSNGLFKLEIMRDTFASIMTNGTWLYTYHSLYDHHFSENNLDLHHKGKKVFELVSKHEEVLMKGVLRGMAQAAAELSSPFISDSRRLFAFSNPANPAICDAR